MELLTPIMMTFIVKNSQTKHFLSLIIFIGLCLSSLLTHGLKS
jgi:hypothetical protein